MDDRMRQLFSFGLSRGEMPPLGNRVVGMTLEGRPVHLNPDGSFSSERTVTLEDPTINQGQPTNIPTIYGNQELSPDAAAEYVTQYGAIPGAAPGSGLIVDPMTGRRLEGFPDIGSAVDAAGKRSAMIRSLLFQAYKPGMFGLR